jgi:hypothetical protein
VDEFNENLNRQIVEKPNGEAHTGEFGKNYKRIMELKKTKELKKIRGIEDRTKFWKNNE